MLKTTTDSNDTSRKVVTTENANSPKVHNKTNTWQVANGEFIPVENMTNEHLQQAKLFAQGREDFFFHKTSQFGEFVDMFDEEAEKRGIKLKDYRSKFQKNQRILKNAIKKM